LEDIGGQMQLLAETFRKKGIESISLAFNSDFRNYENDIKINPRNWFERLLFTFWAIKHYDIFYFFWGVSLLSIKRFHLLDLPLLKIFNKKVIIHFRGSDILNSDYYHYLIYQNNTKPSLINKTQKKKLKKWRNYSDKILISTPNLKYIVEEALLFPQVIDVKYWSRKNIRPSSKDGVIRILHAPTNKAKKGTRYVIEAIEILKEKGYKIELLLADNLSADLTKSYYEKADICIDQLIIGWYGKVSCELMALGTPTICYLDKRLVKNMKIPIINANKNNIVEKIEGLINNSKLRKTIGEKSIEYVKKYHNVDVEAEKLLKLFDEIEK